MCVCSWGHRNGVKYNRCLKGCARLAGASSSHLTDNQMTTKTKFKETRRCWNTKKSNSEKICERVITETQSTGISIAGEWPEESATRCVKIGLGVARFGNLVKDSAVWISFQGREQFLNNLQSARSCPFDLYFALRSWNRTFLACCCKAVEPQLLALEGY